jgi:hypothetical protein
MARPKHRLKRQRRTVDNPNRARNITARTDQRGSGRAYDKAVSRVDPNAKNYDRKVARKQERILGRMQPKLDTRAQARIDNPEGPGRGIPPDPGPPIVEPPYLPPFVPPEEPPSIPLDPVLVPRIGSRRPSPSAPSSRTQTAPVRQKRTSAFSSSEPPPKTISPLLEGFDGSQYGAGAERKAARKDFRRQSRTDQVEQLEGVPPRSGTDFVWTPNMAELAKSGDIVGNEALMRRVMAANPHLMKDGRPLTPAEWHNRMRAAYGTDSVAAGTDPFDIYDRSGNITGRTKDYTGLDPIVDEFVDGRQEDGEETRWRWMSSTDPSVDDGGDLFDNDFPGTGGSQDALFPNVGDAGGNFNPDDPIDPAGNENIQLGQDPLSNQVEQTLGNIMGSGGAPQTEFGLGVRDSIGGLINQGGESNTAMGRSVSGAIQSLLESGGDFDPEVAQMRLTAFEDALDRRGDASDRSSSFRMAGQGIDPGSGVAAGVMRRAGAERDAEFAGAASRYYADEADRASDRFMAATGVGTQLAGRESDNLLSAMGLGSQAAQAEIGNLLSATQITTDRQGQIDDASLNRLAMNMEFSRALAEFGLMREQAGLAERRNQIEMLFPLLQLLGQAASQSAAGYE